MRAGETIPCPHCGERTVAKSKPVMEGWRVTGTVLVCPLCGGELGKPEEETAAGQSFSAAAGKLAALLGGEKEEPAFRLEKTEEYGRFCRNCRHFIVHPFESRCGLTGRAADPMKECGDFVMKSE